jgi:hypothetical protein
MVMPAQETSGARVIDQVKRKYKVKLQLTLFSAAGYDDK